MGIPTKVNPQLTNEQIIKEVSKDLGTAERESLFEKDGSLKDAKDIVRSFNARPSNANAFINALVNRITKEVIYNRRYTNSLNVFAKGDLDFGDSIQDIFVGLLERKGLAEHFTGSTTAEGDLLGKYVPTVNVDYHTINREFKMKVSVEMTELSKAFLNQNGLSNLANQLVEQIATSYEYYEYQDIKHMIMGDAVKESEGVKLPKGLIKQIEEGGNATQIVTCGTNIKDLVKNVRTYTQKLTFMTDAYNLAKVKTHTPSENLIFITTPELIADMDVEVLASAFNVSSTDIKSRMVIIDELPTAVGTKGSCLGVLCDSDVIGIYNKMHNVTGSFYNPENLRNNIFAHTIDMLYITQFANAIVFTNGVKA